MIEQFVNVWICHFAWLRWNTFFKIVLDWSTSRLLGQARQWYTKKAYPKSKATDCLPDMIKEIQEHQQHPHENEEWYQKWLRRQRNQPSHVVEIGIPDRLVHATKQQKTDNRYSYHNRDNTNAYCTIAIFVKVQCRNIQRIMSICFLFPVIIIVLEVGAPVHGRRSQCSPFEYAGSCSITRSICSFQFKPHWGWNVSGMESSRMFSVWKSSRIWNLWQHVVIIVSSLLKS